MPYIVKIQGRWQWATVSFSYSAPDEEVRSLNFALDVVFQAPDLQNLTRLDGIIRGPVPISLYSTTKVNMTLSPSDIID